jgi:hypothetical protein
MLPQGKREGNRLTGGLELSNMLTWKSGCSSSFELASTWGTVGTRLIQCHASGSPDACSANPELRDPGVHCLARAQKPVLI